jgi:hypothetical protein
MILLKIIPHVKFPTPVAEKNHKLLVSMKNLQIRVKISIINAYVMIVNCRVRILCLIKKNYYLWLKTKRKLMIK